MHMLARVQLPLALMLIAFVAIDAVFTVVGLPVVAVDAMLLLAGVLGVPRPSEVLGRMTDALAVSRGNFPSSTVAFPPVPPSPKPNETTGSTPTAWPAARPEDTPPVSGQPDG